VTAETLSCKSEYDTLLREMRDPEVKAFFGADQVAGAKESAKKDWISTERCIKHYLAVPSSCSMSLCQTVILSAYSCINTSIFTFACCLAIIAQ
jgi:hypothetical protein